MKIKWSMKANINNMKSNSVIIIRKMWKEENENKPMKIWQ